MDHYFTSNENLRSDIRHINYKILDNNFTFKSDLGVFSKNKIDYGTNLLLNAYLTNKKSVKKILDVGCGYGIIGIVLGKICSCKVLMTDVNKRSVHLTEMNIKENNVDADVIVSNCYENVNNKFDLIITNPPIRAGKEVVLKILIGAKEHMNKNGELWCVINKNGGAKTFIKHLENHYKVEIIKKSKGFYIIKSKIC